MTVSALRPLNPVLARELKQRMRGRHVWLVVTLYLAILALILRWVYVAASEDNQFDGGFDVLSSATAGRAIFQWLLFFMLLLVCFIVPGLTAGAISGERERQTLIALQLTLLRARSIVIGKLLASLAFVVLLIVASLPLLTVPFLVGGVALSEVVKGLVMVLATAVTLACLTLACSALFRRTQTATVVAYGVTLFMVLGTLLVYGAQQVPRRGSGPRPAPWVLSLNPFAAAADVVQGRSEPTGFESPFAPLHSLLRLSENDRLTNVIARSGPPGFVGPDGPAFFPGAPPTVVGGFVNGEFDPSMFPSSSAAQAFAVGQEFDDTVRLGGMRFFFVSLVLWFLLAWVATVVSVRRIILPASRESS